MSRQVGALLLAAFERHLDRVALITADSELSYEGVLDLVVDRAERLRKVAPVGGRVAILSSTAIDSTLWLLSAIIAGNPAMVQDAFLSPAAQRRQWMEMRPAVLVRDPAEDSAVEADAVDGSLWLVRSPEPIAASMSDECLCVATSGSTGVSKLVVHTQRSLRAALGLLVHMRLANRDGPPIDDLEAEYAAMSGRLVYLSSLPGHSIGGIIPLLHCLCSGDLWVSGYPFEPGGFRSLAARSGATTIATTPYHLSRLVGHIENVDGPRPTPFAISAGSSFVSMDLRARAAKALGAVVLVGYGCTETAGLALATRLDASEMIAGSIGTPVANVEVRLAPLADGEHEIQLNHPAVAAGTLREGRVRPLPLTEDGWYATGDLGQVHGDEIVVTGRISEHVLRGGTRIDGRLIEQCLQEHPGVEAAAVITAESRLPGIDDIVAVVEAVRPLARLALRRHCAESLGIGHTPQRVVFVEALPRLANGEPDRQVLRLAVIRG